MNVEQRLDAIEGATKAMHETLLAMNGREQALLAGLCAIIAASNLKPMKAPIALGRQLQNDADLLLLQPIDDAGQDLIARARERTAAVIHEALLRAELGTRPGGPPPLL